MTFGDAPPQTLVAAVESAARRWPNRAALRFVDGVGVTFAELETEVNRASRCLRRLGVDLGDNVAVMMANRPEFPILWLALAKLGAVIVPMNPQYGTDDAAHVLGLTGVKLVVADDASAERIRLVSAALENPPMIISVDQAADGPDSWLGTAELADDVQIQPQARPDWVVNLQFTSGSTGAPKACMLTHRYWLEIARVAREEMPRLSVDDVVLACTPFYYMDPQWELAACLTTGATLVVMTRFEADRWLDVVRSHSVTFFYCLGVMPALLWRTQRHPDDADNTLRAITCSAIPRSLHRDLEARFGTPWFEAYGSTECGSVIRVLPHDHDEAVRSGFIGTPLTHREVRVLSDAGTPCARGVVGELVVRGTALMDGYYRDEAATEQAFAGGWFHTGDLATIDLDGRVYLSGRIKETIRRGGQNVAPAEVEATLVGHPNVRYAAVIGAPDDVMDEEVEAHVVLISDTDSPVDAGRDLHAYCSARLARYKVPRYWVFSADLPLTSSGKVARAVLAEHRDLHPDRWDARQWAQSDA